MAWSRSVLDWGRLLGVLIIVVVPGVGFVAGVTDGRYCHEPCEAELAAAHKSLLGIGIFLLAVGVTLALPRRLHPELQPAVFLAVLGGLLVGLAAFLLAFAATLESSLPNQAVGLLLLGSALGALGVMIYVAGLNYIRDYRRSRKAPNS